ENAEQDQRATHGRRAALGEVALGALLADDLADLLAAQLLDEPRRDHEAHQHRGDRRHDRAERRVAQHVQERQPADLRGQRVEKLVDHAASPRFCGPAGARRAARRPSTTSSARTPREALTKTTSPACSRSSTSGSAVLESSAKQASTPPARAGATNCSASPET